MRDEFTKHRLLFFGVIAAGILVAVGLYLEPIMAREIGDAAQRSARRNLVALANMPNYILSGLAAIGPFIVTIFGSALMSSELRWRTAQHQQVRLTTSVWLWRKLLFSVIALAGLIAAALAVGAVLSVSAAMVVGAPETVPPTFEMGVFVRQLATTALGLALWLALSMLITLLFRSAIAGTIGTLAYAYVESVVGPATVPATAPYLPATAQVNTLQIFTYAPNAGLIGQPSFLPGANWLTSISTVAVYTAAFVLLIAFFGRRRELRG